MKHTTLVPVILVAGLLSACGSTPKDRGISGAGIGAGAGAVVGAVTGLSVVQGALIGAAAGGLTGVLTDDSQVNLGKPAWKSGSSASADPAPVRNIQAGLSRLGYDPGPADGVYGPKTAHAIRAYQQERGLLVDGKPTAELAAHIQQHGG